MSPESKPTPRECSVSDALAVIGDLYSIELVREIFNGNRRFVDLVGFVGGPRSVVSDRLTKLVDADVLKRRRYSERTTREEYTLTEAGRGSQAHPLGDQAVGGR